MDIHDFTEPQSEALLDLLVLAMYMDGRLASAEEARVQQLLTAMGMKVDYDRNRLFDAAVTRVRQHSENSEAACACAEKLAGNFTTPEHQKRVYDLLNDLVTSDGQVSPGENKFLAAIRNVFQV